LSAIAQDIGELMYAVWSNPSAVLDWLDQEVDITFFSAFYEGLVDHAFTPLDFIALAAAIPYSIVAPDASRKIDDSPTEGLFYTIFALMAVKAGIASLAAGLQDDIDNTSSAKLADRAMLVADLATAILSLAYAADDKQHWYAPAAADLGMACLKAIMIWATEADESNWEYGTAATDMLSIAAGGISALLNALITGVKPDMIGFATASFLADATHLAADRKIINLEDPDQRFAYAAFQGLMGATQTMIFWADGYPPNAARRVTRG
jgi:hypothetical protein